MGYPGIYKKKHRGFSTYYFCILNGPLNIATHHKSVSPMHPMCQTDFGYIHGWNRIKELFNGQQTNIQQDSPKNLIFWVYVHPEFEKHLCQGKKSVTLFSWSRQPSHFSSIISSIWSAEARSCWCRWNGLVRSIRMRRIFWAQKTRSSGRLWERTCFNVATVSLRPYQSSGQ